jgi:hypothetical protein
MWLANQSRVEKVDAHSAKLDLARQISAKLCSLAPLITMRAKNSEFLQVNGNLLVIDNCAPHHAGVHPEWHFLDFAVNILISSSHGRAIHRHKRSIIFVFP